LTTTVAQELRTASVTQHLSHLKTEGRPSAPSI